MVKHRLPRDKFLPLFAPNLKALRISYASEWHHLTYRVVFTLLHLIGLPSLVHLRLLFCDCRQAIVDMALENVKHLALDSGGNDDVTFRHESPPLRPVYLESFSAILSLPLQDHFPPTSPIQISRLRKLVVVALSPEAHAATQNFLRQCRDTLEEFDFTTYHIGKWSSAAPFFICSDSSSFSRLGAGF